MATLAASFRSGEVRYQLKYELVKTTVILKFQGHVLFHDIIHFNNKLVAVPAQIIFLLHGRLYRKKTDGYMKDVSGLTDAIGDTYGSTPLEYFLEQRLTLP